MGHLGPFSGTHSHLQVPEGQGEEKFASPRVAKREPLESQNGRKNSKIYVHAKCGLNGRTKVDLINPNIDLSKVTYPFYKQADWIMPLNIPLSH